MDHVGDADAARIFDVSEGRGDLRPLRFARPLEIHGAAEEVGVGDAQTSRGPVKLDLVFAAGVAVHVEAHDEGDDRAAFEHEGRAVVGLHFDGHHLAEAFLAGDHALVPRARGHGRDRFHRAEHLDERGDEVWPHVEKRAAAFEVNEGRVGVPAFGAGRQHERRAGERLADPAVIDELARGLQAGAQDGVRRAAQAQAFAVRQFQHFVRFRRVQGERLFAVSVLAGFEHLLADARVDLGHGEVDDDLDGRVGQKFRDAACGNIEFFGFGRRRVGADVGAGFQVQQAEPAASLRVGVEDAAATDDADVCRFGFGMFHKGGRAICFPPRGRSR